MSKRNLKVYLDDILESIQQIEEYLDGVSEKEFYKDQVRQDAVLRRLEIIGEAVKQIPDGIRNNYKDVPWRKIAGMRDVIIHQYFGIMLSRVWVAIQRDLPELKMNIQEIREQEF
jgi:uncharacterized protein with HEPN domain